MDVSAVPLSLQLLPVPPSDEDLWKLKGPGAE